MEDEHHKLLPSSSVAFVAKGRRLTSKRPFSGKQVKKGPCALQNSQPKNGIAKKQKAKANGAKNIVCVKYYNCGKKGDFARDYPKLAKAPSPTKTSKINVYSHAFIANFLTQWIVDT